MKKLIVALALGCVACGGGGGGSDGPSAREVCTAYCDFSCSKLANCLDVADNGSCGDTCINTIIRNGTEDVDACQTAFDQIASMSCFELLTFVGSQRQSRGVDLGQFIEGLVE